MSFGKIIGLVIWSFLALCTTSKLLDMCAIKGWLPGGQTEIEVITGKVQTGGRYGPAYWVSWNGVNPNEMGDNRMNLSYELWKTLNIGDEIEVCYLNDSKAYHKSGIFVSQGNFMFDLVLLSVELSGIVICSLPLLRLKKP